MRIRLIIGLLCVCLFGALAMACGSSGEDGPEVEPLETILAGPPEVTDLTATAAVLRVETTVDVVCSVVFGTDESYGLQSTDLDMGGLPHSSHSAPLRPLEPDTLYHYRLQGTGSDGTIYVSGDLTFRTPPPSESGAGFGTNVAGLTAGAGVTEASSSFSEAFRPENAIDQDPATEWSSAGDGNDAFITIELAETTKLSAVGIWTRTMGDSAQIGSFRVVTEDGTELGPFDVPDSAQMHLYEVSATASQLRFEVIESSGGNTGIVELAAYAAE